MSQITLLFALSLVVSAPHLSSALPSSDVVVPEVLTRDDQAAPRIAEKDSVLPKMPTSPVTDEMELIASRQSSTRNGRRRSNHRRRQRNSLQVLTRDDQAAPRIADKDSVLPKLPTSHAPFYQLIQEMKEGEQQGCMQLAESEITNVKEDVVADTKFAKEIADTALTCGAEFKTQMKAFNVHMTKFVESRTSVLDAFNKIMADDTQGNQAGYSAHKQEGSDYLATVQQEQVIQNLQAHVVAKLTADLRECERKHLCKLVKAQELTDGHGKREARKQSVAHAFYMICSLQKGMELAHVQPKLCSVKQCSQTDAQIKSGDLYCVNGGNDCQAKQDDTDYSSMLSLQNAKYCDTANGYKACTNTQNECSHEQFANAEVSSYQIDWPLVDAWVADSDGGQSFSQANAKQETIEEWHTRLRVKKQDYCDAMPFGEKKPISGQTAGVGDGNLAAMKKRFDTSYMYTFPQETLDNDFTGALSVDELNDSKAWLAGVKTRLSFVIGDPNDHCTAACTKKGKSCSGPGGKMEFGGGKMAQGNPTDSQYRFFSIIAAAGGDPYALCGKSNGGGRIPEMCKNTCGFVKNEGKHSGTYAQESGHEVRTPFSLEGAKAKCLALGATVCKAVTCRKGSTHCTVRANENLEHSGAEEVTYVPDSNCQQQNPVAKECGSADASKFWFINNPLLDGPSYPNINNGDCASKFTSGDYMINYDCGAAPAAYGRPGAQRLCACSV